MRSYVSELRKQDELHTCLSQNQVMEHRQVNCCLLDFSVLCFQVFVTHVYGAVIHRLMKVDLNGNSKGSSDYYSMDTVEIYFLLYYQK